MRVKTPARQRGTWAVTAGALTAAFGVATCCALPLALALFGLDFSWPIVRAKINAAARHVRHPPIRGL